MFWEYCIHILILSRGQLDAGLNIFKKTRFLPISYLDFGCRLFIANYTVIVSWAYHSVLKEGVRRIRRSKHMI